MSHEIETFDDGSAAFVSARKDAWHRLGTVLPDCFDAETAMRVAHLGGWNVRKVGLKTEGVLTEDGVTVLDLPEKYATIRTHPLTGKPEVLGVVGEQYVPVQNEAHCDVLNALVDESGAHFETAGSLRTGRQVFVTMKLPQTMKVGGVDEIDLYIAGLNSHDGSSAFRLIVSPVRIVCANTQAMALALAKQSFSMRHTAGVTARIEEARQALELTWKYTDQFQTEAEKMIQTTMTEEQYMKVVKIIIPEPKGTTSRGDNAYKRTIGDLRALWSAPTQANIAGTRWAGFQAITEWVDHVAPVRTKGDKDAARALRSLTDGWAADRKNRAFELLKV